MTSDPPNNIEIEAALLGALLRSDLVVDRIPNRLAADHFFAPEHRLIFRQIRNLSSNGQFANAATLSAWADNERALEHVDGSRYLFELCANIVTIVNAPDYADQIIDLARRRALIDSCTELIAVASDLDADQSASEIQETHETQLSALAEGHDSGGGFRSMGAIVSDELDFLENTLNACGTIAGLSTGFKALDDLTGGLHAGNMIVVAARTAMGKTALAGNIARHVGADHLVAVFSLEMSGGSLADRLIAEDAGVSVARMRRGKFSHDDYNNKIVPAAFKVRDLSIHIDDTPNLSAFAIRNRARRLKRRRGLDLIIVDYLQILGGNERSNINRVEKVANDSRALRQAARELEVPIVVLSQLSRQVEQREDKRPKLSDLRESGAIEQDADMVWLLYRPEYYLERERPERKVSEAEGKFTSRENAWLEQMVEARGKAELIIAKHRNGPTASVHLSYDGALNRFSDPQSEDEAAA